MTTTRIGGKPLTFSTDKALEEEVVLDITGYIRFYTWTQHCFSSNFTYTLNESCGLTQYNIFRNLSVYRICRTPKTD